MYTSPSLHNDYATYNYDHNNYIIMRVGELWRLIKIGNGSSGSCLYVHLAILLI